MGISEKDRRLHTYIVGGTGSGKSEFIKSLLLDQLQRLNVAIILVDPKGDLALQVGQFKENAKPDRANRLVYLDPYLDPYQTFVINPFDLPDDITHQNYEQYVDITTQELTKTFGLIFKEINSDFTMQMSTVLEPCIATILRKPDGDLWDLQRFMDDNLNADLVELGRKTPNVAHRYFFETNFFSKDYAVSKRGVYTRLQHLLNSPTFATLVTGKSTVNLRRAVNERKLIVLSLAKGDMGTKISTYFGKIVLSLLQVMALQRNRIPVHERVPTHLYVDEFQNYITPTIAEILTESRKYGLYLTLAHQTVGQNMETDLNRDILGNTNVKIIGRSSHHNWLAMSKEMGISTGELSSIKNPGEFYATIGNNTPFKINAPKNSLGDKNAMSKEAWDSIVVEQLEKYYTKRRKKELPKPPTPYDEPPATKPRWKRSGATASRPPASPDGDKPIYDF